MTIKKMVCKAAGKIIMTVFIIFVLLLSILLVFCFNFFVKTYLTKGQYNKLIVKNRYCYLSVAADRLVFLSEAEKPVGEYPFEGKKLVSFCVSDMDGDGSDEVLLLLSDKAADCGEDLKILSWDGSGSIKELYKADFSKLKPWKVQTADVDGDKKKEISLGVFKTATFDPVAAKRPFIYNWSPGGLSPKWLGSRLSRPFGDYIFKDINNDKKDELVALEQTPDKKKLINSYVWKGFGFEGYAESDVFEDICNLSQSGNAISASVKIRGKFKRASFELAGNRLKIIY